MTQSQHYTWSTPSGGGKGSPTLLGPREPQLEGLSWVSSNLLRCTGKARSCCSRPAQNPTAGQAAPTSHTLYMSGHADRTENTDWPYVLTVVLSSLRAGSEIKAGPACL